ncbi:unnamed protein product [Rotaria sordida]|uniref:Uncharacterized protein n=1 Tax=Rotaria sordida TaxID=392033 RepID=A0A818IP75_9BILA|nr:unnamed protein product [Rotaria sordida]
MGDNIDIPKLSLVWLDNSNSDSQENVFTQQQLRLFDSNLKLFKTTNECETYIKSQSTDAHITLIVNGGLGKQLVPNVHDLSQIIAIYVKAVLADLDELKRHLQSSHTNISDHSITSEVPPTTDAPKRTIVHIETTYELDCSYMISDTCFDCFARMKTQLIGKDDFITLCRAALQKSENFLPILLEFQEGYHSDQAIFWLYRDPFFHVLIENMFKLADIDSMLSCQFFIHDIHKQLEQHKCTSTIEVYKGEVMLKEMFQQLNNFNGKVIAMKSFFLTNSDRNTALSCISNISLSNEYQRILFIIEANPQIENVKLFAKISSLINNKDSNDVLFMIGSLFKITEIQNEQDGIINIKMSLCGNDSENASKAMFDQLKYKYMDSNQEIGAIGFGQLLFEIGHSILNASISDRGEKYIDSYANKLPNDDPDRLRCYDALGSLDLLTGNFESSLNWFKKSFDIKKEKLQPNDPNLIESYQNMALVYLNKKDFTQALDYFMQLVTILKQLYGDNYFNLTVCYTQIANIHENEQRFSEALSYYHQALAIMAKYSYDDAQNFAIIYNNLGKVYTLFGNYHLALGFYKTSLEMKLKYLSPVHPSIAITYKNIGLVYGSMNDVQQTRENLEKALDIYRQLYTPDVSCVTEIEEIIQNLPTAST